MPVDVEKQEPIFSYRHPAALGLPLVIQFVMVIAFGMPAVACVLFTIHELPGNPWLLLLYLAAMFPLLVLYVLARLMSRYGLVVFRNGDVDIIYPFSKVSVNAGKLGSIVSDSRYIPAMKSHMTWFRFVDNDGQIIFSLAKNAFSHQVYSDFFAALQAANPGIRITV